VVDASLAAMDSMLAATYPAGGPGASVIVARDGRVLMRKAYGSAHVELGVPMRPDHVIRTGSITKQFTAVAVLMLADEGRLSLDDEITKFFPDYPTHGRRITVEHLLTHTSGIQSYTDVDSFDLQMRNDVTPAALIAGFRDRPMTFAPGEDWWYNNSGYALLGAIIEQVEGRPWGEVLRTRIFQPLGMTDTRYETHGDIIPRRVPGYGKTREGLTVNGELGSVTQAYAAGGVLSTVDDLLRWQMAVEEGRLLRPETWSRAHTAYRLGDGRTSGYGFGWFISQLAGRPSVEHGGDIYGFSSDGVWIPSERLHVIILTNVDRSFANPATHTRRIIGTLLGMPEGIPAAVPVDAEKLDDYVGTYAIGSGEPRVITRDGGTLYTQRGTDARQELRPVGPDEFVVPSSGSRMFFDRDAGGRVVQTRLLRRIGGEERPMPRVPAP
jgi:D-alanyl-D-alanine carboxypeptidase